MEQRYCAGIGCDIMLASYQGTHCDACYIATPAERHIEWMKAQPKTLDFCGARCGLAQLAHLAVLLETHGTVLVRNCAIQDTPGSMLLDQGIQLGDARANRRELAQRPDGR